MLLEGFAYPAGARLRPLARRRRDGCVRAWIAYPVVVAVVHQNSGPGFVVYACQACAAHYPPQPDVLTVLRPSGQAWDE